MGGFEGGDEGGYWEVEVIPNILKKQNNKDKAKKQKQKLSKLISFVPFECKTFTIEGCNEVDLKSNMIYKIYNELIEFTNDSDIVDFFNKHKVVIKKNMGNNINDDYLTVAAFLYLCKDNCNLILSTDELVQISSIISDEISSYL